jgi:hypothetical protein
MESANFKNVPYRLTNERNQTSQPCYCLLDFEVAFLATK